MHKFKTQNPKFKTLNPNRYKDLKAQLVGLMFDSCPAYMYRHKGAKALSAGMHPILGLLMRMLFTVYSSLAMPFVGNITTRFWCATDTQPDLVPFALHSLHECDPGCPDTMAGVRV